ncbi:MAG: hypothetical protein KatS3mg129_0422 [Leptospiraceae bacterium]|nr:MAG: hypothetical protein KatS3mg129_0422 [Leptospiraceae bacterium]
MKKILDKIAECVLPKDNNIIYSFKDINYDNFINEVLKFNNKEVKLLIFIYIFFLEYFSFLFDLKFKRFSKKSFEERYHLLEKLRGHTNIIIRGPMILISSLFLIPYFSHPSVMKEIGYFGFQPNINKI